MFGSRQATFVAVGLVMLLGVYWVVAADTPQPAQREALMKAYNSGNFRDAYDGLRKLALDPKDDSSLVGNDLTTAIQCLRNLGRVDEIDEFREGVIAVHKSNWRLLETAATTYAGGEKYGFIVAGQFYRGNKRGGGKYVGTMERDRVRALQLMQQALPIVKNEQDKPAAAQFHLHFANMLLTGGGYHAPWRLQYLTDLSQLPDYEEGYRHYYGGDNRGGPVDENGNPVYHKMPESYEKASTDGERWRWNLQQTALLAPARLNEVEMIFGNFLQSQFGVRTLAQFGYHFGRQEDKKDEKTGTFSLHTLKENETIARLANGIKRFQVPDEFNWIVIYNRVAARGKSHYGERARDTLAQIFEDRRQYPKAATAWKKAIEEYGVGNHNHRGLRLDQIVGNWGRFEPGQMQPAGKGAIIDYRFRNGEKVAFEAFEVKVPKVLEDVKNYLKNHQGQLDWNQTNIGDIGYRLIQLGQQQYLGAKVANWDLDLTPRPNHVDDRVTVTTPLQKPGAYLLTAQMANGNLSRIIVWVNDTVIVKKQLEGKAYYFVADAVNGKPVPEANLEFFGWRQVQVALNRNEWRVETRMSNEKTDADGQLLVGNEQQPVNYQWLVTASRKRAQGPDRFAYLGFSGVWYNNRYDPEYNQTKVFTITDRPVYRPANAVKFKFWVRHAKYDEPDVSSFAGKSFTVQIHNPRGEKVFDKGFTADEYGGFDGEFPLSKDAMLGQYQVYIPNQGGGSFRVEEYKKPEFEVKVDAPKEPVQLGDKIEATIQAKYYFGAPVAKGKVKYKVTRSSYSTGWYPTGVWDWFYGRGYWWFAADYPWYPGWDRWCGCKRPIPWWWGQNHTPPEIVLENEIEVGADGIVKVAIDTLPAKELHGDEDQQYTVTAEVTDESRRTIVGTGNVLVARKPFQVFSWTNQGHYRTGDPIVAMFKAQTLDQKPVEGKGTLTLFKITYNDKSEPVEAAVEKWDVDTNVEGEARQQLKAADVGQYRLSYKVTDAKKHTIEGGYVFVVRGQGFDGADFRFNDIEIITDKREYKPGEKVKLMINTNRAGAAVLMFVRPTNGVYVAPKVLHLRGKSYMEEVEVTLKDMPNFFVEAVTIADSRVYSEMREVVVPPEKRVVNVEVVSNKPEYLPGEKASVKVKLTDLAGKPFIGSTVLTMYDKSVEYISGGSNVPEIKEFFWKWRRHHNPHTESSLMHYFNNLFKQGEIGMSNLGLFGEMVVEEFQGKNKEREGRTGGGKGEAFEQGRGLRKAMNAAPGMFMLEDAKRDGADKDASLGAAAPAKALADRAEKKAVDERAGGGPGGGEVQPTVRKNFADTAFWAAALTTNKDGLADVAVTMPEQLTGWKIKTWAMGHGTKVGQGEIEVTTKKNLLVRLQAPRFFTQKDEVVLSANVHNYLKTEKEVKVALELNGGTLAVEGSPNQKVTIPAGGEKRVDWLVKVTKEGEAVVRMKALTDEESDAMEMRFPCYVHGMLKMESFSGVVRSDEKGPAQVVLTVPAERRINETRLEVRYSPTLAGALVDALPYMVDYPYGCTEQTLNRFLPTVITRRILQKMNLDLKDIRDKRTNLNAQEIGDDQKRGQGWKRLDRNPVFDEEEVKKMVGDGIQALTAMQLSDGGWGWFSGWGEHSWPHTTAVVVHGLQIAKENDVKLPPGMLERGIAWLENYQQQQIQLIKNAPNKIIPWKQYADNLDAFVYMVLADASKANGEMNDFLYRDRVQLSVYAKAMYGLALHKQQQADKLTMILKNIDQFVMHDDENQTAYLKLPENNYWWYWYGSEIEADGYYLKLLSRTDPKGKTAPCLVKYLLNNRKHATYWNSTRDTAVCIEAMADYLKASGEDKPDMTIEVWLDGKKHKEVKIDNKNLFSFDNKLVMLGDAIDTGKHTVEIRRMGTGPVYFNAYLTNFTSEDHITRAGLEVKVNRKYYKLTPVDKKIKVSGSRGQVADQKVEKYKRTELSDMAQLKSGELVEVELEIDSKNDYEYLIFEDPKAAGFEPMLVRSGYNPNDMGAYMELRDEKVCFFVRALARGKHSVSYRLRAEIPGKFSALPTRGYAMYAPELKGNSDEIKLRITD